MFPAFTGVDQSAPCIGQFIGSFFISRRLFSIMKNKNIRGTRGAFIVLEGLDRAGKSTQVVKLMQALKQRSIPVEKRVFPDRSTAIGEIINNYLTKKVEIPSESVHLLFAANRWECKDEIYETLKKGTTLIVDRYAASGAAYSCATTNQSLEWCKSPDCGLPAPDLVLYLEVSEEEQSRRANWGEERFERVETQRKVAANFQKLAVPGIWTSIPSGSSKEEVHQIILKKALDVIESCKEKPIDTLYMS